MTIMMTLTTPTSNNLVYWSYYRALIINLLIQGGGRGRIFGCLFCACIHFFMLRCVHNKVVHNLQVHICELMYRVALYSKGGIKHYHIDTQGIPTTINKNVPLSLCILSKICSKKKNNWILFSVFVYTHAKMQAHINPQIVMSFKRFQW